MNSTTHILAALFLLAHGLGAQAPQPVVIEGQSLPGGGTVTGIRCVQIIGGGWVVQVTTDQPESRSAVLRQGGFTPTRPLWKRVGDRVLEPGGARIAAFDSFSSELFGGVVWNAQLRDTPGGATDDEVVYFENKLWIQEGPIVSPPTDFPAGSLWISFDDVRCSVQDGYFLLRGRADDPTMAGPDETFAAFGTLCGSVGILCQLERFAYEGWPAPGTGQLIEAVRLEPGAAAIAPTDASVVWSCDLTGPTGSDGCIYKFIYYPEQHTLLAQEGTPSPVAGRNWGPLDDPGVHINSSGAWTLRATLDAGDPIIVKDGAVFVRAGDTLPAIAPFTFDGFGRGRALLDQDGHVVWYGHWNEHGHPSEALFRDDQVLVRAGRTLVGGQVLAGLSSGPDDLSLAPQGELLLFKGTLAGGLEGAFTLEL